jgi:hypothetical protein
MGFCFRVSSSTWSHNDSSLNRELKNYHVRPLLPQLDHSKSEEDGNSLSLALDPLYVNIWSFETETGETERFLYAVTVPELDHHQEESMHKIIHKVGRPKLYAECNLIKVITYFIPCFKSDATYNV